MTLIFKRCRLKSILFILSILLCSGNLKSQTINHWETVIMASDIWHYFIGNSEPPSTWMSTGFDDSGWLEGPGGIGYGDDDDATIISSVTSVYLRKRFELVDTSVISFIILNVDFDDGFVAYLNGHEVARINIGTPGVRSLYNEYALLTTYEAQIPMGGIPARFILNRDSLAEYMVQGSNVLSLQVHNCNATSTDLSSSAWLSLGIEDNSQNYRAIPGWFSDIRNESSVLPLLAIDTRGQTILNDPKITALLKVINNGPGKLNYFIQKGTDFDGYIGIEFRGQSSLSFPKKSFGFETRDSEGNNLSASLLGMPEDEDWVLYAPYSDKSLLRNAITFNLGSKMGIWQPRYRFCDVYLDGNYHGIYLLIEKIKRSSDRLDINKLKADEIAGDDLTGGYIVKVDKTGDLTPAEYFRTSPSIRYVTARDYNFTYVYPKFDEIVPEQKAYIINYLTGLQEVLNGRSFKDTTAGFRKYLDISSFIDYQIMQELANNVDGYRYSTFFYKKRDSDGGKLFAGPLWDLDLGYGNVNYSTFGDDNLQNLSTDRWLYPNFGPTENYPMHWWARLMEDDGYRAKLVKRWRELRAGPFMTDSIMETIDNTILEIRPASDRNFARWPVLGEYIWPNYFIGETYEQEVEYLKNWIADRLDWMDGNIVAASRNDVSTLLNEIVVYPNPVKTQLNLRFHLDSKTKIEIEIYDLYGKKTYSEVYLPEFTGYQDFGLIMPKALTGYYLLIIKQNGSVYGRQKLMITGGK